MKASQSLIKGLAKGLWAPGRKHTSQCCSLGNVSKWSSWSGRLSQRNCTQFPPQRQTFGTVAISCTQNGINSPKVFSSKGLLPASASHVCPLMPCSLLSSETFFPRQSASLSPVLRIFVRGMAQDSQASAAPKAVKKDTVAAAEPDTKTKGKGTPLTTKRIVRRKKSLHGSAKDAVG